MLAVSLQMKPHCNGPAKREISIQQQGIPDTCPNNGRQCPSPGALWDVEARSMIFIFSNQCHSLQSFHKGYVYPSTKTCAVDNEEGHVFQLKKWPQITRYYCLCHLYVSHKNRIFQHDSRRFYLLIWKLWYKILVHCPSIQKWWKEMIASTETYVLQ